MAQTFTYTVKLKSAAAPVVLAGIAVLTFDDHGNLLFYKNDGILGNYLYAWGQQDALEYVTGAIVP